jgi:hypothetical protein
MSTEVLNELHGWDPEDPNGSQVSGSKYFLEIVGLNLYNKDKTDSEVEEVGMGSRLMVRPACRVWSD